MAIKEQIISVGDYIFRAYKMTKVKATQKEKLTIEELKLLISQQYKDGSLIKTRNNYFY